MSTIKSIRGTFAFLTNEVNLLPVQQSMRIPVYKFEICFDRFAVGSLIQLDAFLNQINL